jgi:hypothetical protein
MVLQLGWLWPCPQILRTDWKGFPSSSPLAYYASSSVTKEKSIITLTPAQIIRCHKFKTWESFYFKATQRDCDQVTRRLEKNLPNFSKKSPKSCQVKKSQNINNKAQFENPKHLHQTTFKTLK